VSLGYAGRVIAAVRPNIVFIDQPPSDQIMAAVVVTTDALGNITSIRLKKSSGFAPWDDAVLRALNKTRVMPRDINGSVPSPMLLKFRPSDMGSAP
jgi:colicin import membrane protein